MESEHCERCGEKLHPSTTVYLQLNNLTGRYSKGGVPDSEDQGWFAFGSRCAARVIEKDGVLDRIGLKPARRGK